MGSVIAKITADPHDTRYVRWTSITDDMTHLFETEGEVIEYLLGDFPKNSWDHDRQGFIDSTIRPLVDRAKETGCSGRTNLSSQFRFDAADGDRIHWANRGMIHRRHLDELCDLLFYDDTEGENDAADAAEAKLQESGVLIPFDRD